MKATSRSALGFEPAVATDVTALSPKNNVMTRDRSHQMLSEPSDRSLSPSERNEHSLERLMRANQALKDKLQSLGHAERQNPFSPLNVHLLPQGSKKFIKLAVVKERDHNGTKLNG